MEKGSQNCFKRRRISPVAPSPLSSGELPDQPETSDHTKSSGSPLHSVSLEKEPRVSTACEISIQEDQVVSFGMVGYLLFYVQVTADITKLLKILVDAKENYKEDTSHPLRCSVKLDESRPVVDTLLRESDMSIYGSVDSITARILERLKSSPGMTFQMYCTMELRSDSLPDVPIKRGKTISKYVSLLSVILYGPNSMFDRIGEFFSKCKMYLQDPIQCDLNVPYMNPHLLSQPKEKPIMTWEISADELEVSIESVATKPSLLTLLETEDILPETEPPLSLAIALYR